MVDVVVGEIELVGDVVVGDIELVGYIELVGDVFVGDIKLVGDVVIGDIELVSGVAVGDIGLLGDTAVGDIMYNISQAILQFGKHWMQTVLKERTYHAERYVETSFGWFYRKICSVLWSIVF